jgi:hypothetical protein
MSIARSDWPRLLTLVEQALGLPAPQRAGWLRYLDVPSSLKLALLSVLEWCSAIETGNFLAEQADDQLTRQVALKLPHAGHGQDVLAARLLRERNILAALEQPHIARLYDVGVTDAGTPYLVMEYVDGDTLLAHADAQRRRCSRCRAPWPCFATTGPFLKRLRKCEALPAERDEALLPSMAWLQTWFCPYQQPPCAREH